MGTFLMAKNFKNRVKKEALEIIFTKLHLWDVITLCNTRYLHKEHAEI